jgi:hypothetical protein
MAGAHINNVPDIGAILNAGVAALSIKGKCTWFDL